MGANLIYNRDRGRITEEVSAALEDRMMIKEMVLLRYFVGPFLFLKN